MYRNGHGGTASPSTLNDTYKRPSVDSLLDELSNAGPIYAVPNGLDYSILMLNDC